MLQQHKKMIHFLPNNSDNKMVQYYVMANLCASYITIISSDAPYQILMQ
jgi:hypothetical protein